MKTIQKRFGVLCLFVVMCVFAWASEIPNNTIYYTSDDGEVVIPNATDVFGANIVSNTYENGQGIITFDGDVTQIGNVAFRGCYHFTSITIPNSVKSIGDYAFYWCYNLTDIKIPDNVESIGSYAFGSCGHLACVSMSNNVRRIANNAFEYCSELTDISISKGITSLEDNVFENCSALTDITIPNSVTSIGKRAFRDCWKLASISIPNSVKSIGTEAFQNCYGLESITLPNSMTSIEYGVFDHCGLREIIIPNGVTSIGHMAFSYCTNLSDISIPNSVTSIGYEAFHHCSSLTSFNVSKNVTSIGPGVLGGCSNLETIEVDAENTCYNSRNNCNAIIDSETNELLAGCKNTIIPDGVTSIGHDVFYNCRDLKTVTIPSSVTYIGSYAFAATGITSIVIPNSVTDMGQYSFSGCLDLTSATFSDGATIIGNAMFSFCPKLTNVTIPNSMKTICWGAFGRCSGLTSINIPNSVKEIGSYAFQNCTGLKNIVIPNAIEKIEVRTFLDCSSLTNVLIPASVTLIDENAFEGCSNLSSVTCLAQRPPRTMNNSFSRYGTLHVLSGCKAIYSSYSYSWHNFKIVDDASETLPETIKIGTSGYATYCSEYNLDFTNVDGIKAYIASSFDPKTGALTTTRVYNVPAGEGMLLKGTAGESYDIPTTDDVNIVMNLFKGTTAAFTLYPTDNGKTNFVFTKGTSGKYGFYRFTGSVSMPSNKAWLQIPSTALSNNTKGFSLIEEDEEVTGISDINIKDDSADNSATFDLQGRRLVNRPAHGLYIKNGKMVVVK